MKKVLLSSVWVLEVLDGPWADQTQSFAGCTMKGVKTIFKRRFWYGGFGIYILVGSCKRIRRDGKLAQNKSSAEEGEGSMCR